MNHSIPDWNFESDLPISNHRKLLGQDNEVVELLWENGQVVLHSQAQRKHVPNLCESRQLQKDDQPTSRVGTTSLSYGNSSNLIHDDETVSWIQYPIEDSFEKEFCSNFFSQSPLSDPMEADSNKPNRQLDQHQQQFFKSSAAASPAIPSISANSQQLHVSSAAPESRGNLMPPPKFQFDSAQQNKDLEGLSMVLNFLPVTEHTGGKSSVRNSIQREVKECSGMTVGSSYCGSNQVRNDFDFSRGLSNGFGTTTTGLSAGTWKDDARKAIVQNEKGKTETIEPTVTCSSSGGSGSCFDRTCKQSTGVISSSSHKRKSRDGEDYECQSEAAELQLAAANKPTQRYGSSRRSRAAEVHNLSERRRRDRINEKMRALKELIPHCNKTDKASMLDEAIEYLKSLQLQLQLMWMGSGMAPMMFPGIQHYMSRMGMGMGPHALPSIHNPLHLSRMPVVDQSMSMPLSQNQDATCQNQQLNPVNYQHHVQNRTFSEQYPRFLGFHHMQTASQPMNMFGYGFQTIAQSPVVNAPSSSIRPLAGGAATTNNRSLGGKMG